MSSCFKGSPAGVSVLIFSLLWSGLVWSGLSGFRELSPAAPSTHPIVLFTTDGNSWRLFWFGLVGLLFMSFTIITIHRPQRVYRPVWVTGRWRIQPVALAQDLWRRCRWFVFHACRCSLWKRKTNADTQTNRTCPCLCSLSPLLHGQPVFFCGEKKKKHNSCMTSGLEAITAEGYFDIFNSCLCLRANTNDTNSPLRETLGESVASRCSASFRDWRSGEPPGGKCHPPWPSWIFCATFGLLPGNVLAAGLRCGRPDCAGQTSQTERCVCVQFAFTASEV